MNSWCHGQVLYAAALIPVGLLADRVNRPRLLAGGLVMWSLLTMTGSKVTLVSSALVHTMCGQQCTFHLVLIRSNCSRGEALLHQPEICYRALATAADTMLPFKHRLQHLLLMMQLCQMACTTLLFYQYICSGCNTNSYRIFLTCPVPHAAHVTCAPHETVS